MKRTTAEVRRIERNAELGMRIVNLLSLKVRDDGRVVTSWGTKSLIGLGSTVRRIVGEVPE